MRNIHTDPAFFRALEKEFRRKKIWHLASALMCRLNINPDYNDLTWCFSGEACCDNRTAIMQWLDIQLADESDWDMNHLCDNYTLKANQRLQDAVLGYL